VRRSGGEERPGRCSLLRGTSGRAAGRSSGRVVGGRRGPRRGLRGGLPRSAALTACLSPAGAMAALGRSCQGIPAGPALEFPQAAAAPDRPVVPGDAVGCVQMVGNGSDGGCGSSGVCPPGGFDIASLAALGSYNEGVAVPPVGSFTPAPHPQQSHSR